MVKRAASEHKSDRKENRKRTKVDIGSGIESGKFTSPEDVRVALENQDTNALTQALTALRNQLTVKPNEDVFTPQDERLLLAKGWLESSPGARDVFSIIDRTPQPSPTVTSLCLAILASLLHLLSTHLIYHALGEPIVKILLSPSRMRQLSNNLSSASSDMVLSTLKVLNVMSTFAGGAEQRSLMEGFAWGQKSLQKLFFLRRKGKGIQETDPVTRPDIRTLYIFFILSFLPNSTPTPIKLSLLEQHRDVFLLIFKGLSQDPYVVARYILDVCWEGVWNDPKIKRTLKIGLFSEPTLNHILKLYTRDESEDETADHIPADLVHHFMLALATRPGVGICFKDRGWYPRDQSLEELKAGDIEDRDEFFKPQGGKIYNKILANIVKGLKVNEDARQQELAFKILEACPELVAGYWGAANLTLEPRLSSRWITNISVVGTIISLPIPTSSFLLPHSTQHNPTPPPLLSALANILPSVLIKAHLTKGLQSTSSLVQHCTSLTLSKCLAKLNIVLSSFREAAGRLEEDEESGQWSKRARELESEVEKRVPDFMVVIAMVQQKHVASGERSTAKGALLTESALRLLWLYHKLFPRLIAEVRFDVGKLLLSVVDPMMGKTPNDEMDTETSSKEATQSGMDVLRQLHVLRLLRESDQFVWSSKSGPSSHSYLHTIFTLYTKTPHPAVRGATSKLLAHLLSSSILFSHDPTELAFWLGALPLTLRAPNATAPDGTVLSDESTGVLAFLDDCFQRCNKTPYRYLEDSQALFVELVSEDRMDDVPLAHDSPHAAPSPLLMTVLEQLRAKVSGNLLSPSDTLAIMTFMRKLVCSMTCKQPDLHYAWKVAEKLEEIFSMHNVAPNSPLIRDAVKRERDLLSNTLHFIVEPVPCDPVPSSPAVQDFLTQVEAVPTPSSNTAAANAAYELVDWMRLIHPPLHPSAVKRLFKTLLRLWPSAAKDFFHQLDPQQGQLWSCNEDNVRELEKHLPFEWAYWHSTPARMTRQAVKDCLISFFYSESAWSSSPEHRISIIMHRLASSRKGLEKSFRHAELSLLSSIMLQSRDRRAELDVDAMKKAIFVDSRPIRELCCSRDISRTELAELSALVKITLNHRTTSDKALALEYCNYWLAQLNNFSNLQSCAFASPWVAFMEPKDVMQYLDVAIAAIEGGHQLTDTDQNTLGTILETLGHFCDTSQLLPELQARSRGLLTVRIQLHQRSTVDTLLALIVEAGLPLGYNALPLSMTALRSASDVTMLAQERWKNRDAARVPLDSTLISALLHSGEWDETTSRMMSGAVYRSSAARHTFWAWLIKSVPPEGPSLRSIVIPLHACLDVMSMQGVGEMALLPELWFVALARCLLFGENADEAHTLCASCIWIVCQAQSSSRKHYANHLLKEVRNGHSGVNRPFVLLVRDLHRFDADIFSTLLHEIDDKVLEWMANVFSDEMQSDNDISLAESLTAVVSRTEANLKAHLVEPVLKAAIQSCLAAPRIIKCVVPLVSSTRLKPVIVNRLLQSVMQHSQLYRLTDPSLSTREPIVKLLYSLFHLHPANTCQPSHVAPLTRLYGGTLSLADRLLLSVFHMYEKQRKESTASVFRHSYSSPSSPLWQDSFGTITSLDPPKVFRTCTAFPTRRHLDAGVIGLAPLEDDGAYDPVFLTLLLGQLLVEHKNFSATDWVQLFRSNIVSAVMCVLTSRDEALREVGRSTLAGVLQQVQEGDFLEKTQVIYILDILRDLLPSPTLPLPHLTPRLPTHPVLLLAHALRSTFYPSSFLYPIVSRFLLQRPELDTTDVPMLYALLYSSDDTDWTKERTWMIRFLTDAVREGGGLDWAVIKRRHTWDLLASVWQATRLEERALRRCILEFLANLSSNPHTITSLILRSSLLSWIEMQLHNVIEQDAEGVAWVKILENIMLTANRDKADKATCGEFSATIVRCLDLVLRDIKGSGIGSLVLLQLVSRVLLRVAMGASSPSAVAAVLKNAINVLRELESGIEWTTDDSSNPPLSAPPPEAPHYARGLFDLSEADDALSLVRWGDCVYILWRVSMSLGHSKDDAECWDAMTCRMLVLRASNVYHWPESDADLGEWARRETVCCFLVEEGKK